MYLRVFSFWGCSVFSGYYFQWERTETSFLFTGSSFFIFFSVGVYTVVSFNKTFYIDYRVVFYLDGQVFFFIFQIRVRVYVGIFGSRFTVVIGCFFRLVCVIYSRFFQGEFKSARARAVLVFYRRVRLVDFRFLFSIVQSLVGQCLFFFYYFCFGGGSAGSLGNSDRFLNEKLRGNRQVIGFSETGCGFVGTTFQILQLLLKYSYGY